MNLPHLSQQERAEARHQGHRGPGHQVPDQGRSENRADAPLPPFLARPRSEPALDRLKVCELFEALPGIGKVRATVIMSELGIAPTRRVRGLGVHQRRALVDYLGQGHERRRGPSGNTKRTKPRSGVTVLAGPTAVGKGTVSTFIRDNYPDVWLSVSATTRPARPGEEEGVHYFFKTADDFDSLVADGDLLEWAVVHGVNRYGTLRSTVEAAVAARQIGAAGD